LRSSHSSPTFGRAFIAKYGAIVTGCVAECWM
jgi:hypothetical protein